MYCPNCGANLPEKSTYCLRCGSSIDIVNNGTPQIKIERSGNLLSSEQRDSLERAYVGSKYDKFLYSDFNIWCFLFSGFYCFYRRYYSYGALTIIVAYIINLIGNIISKKMIKLVFESKKVLSIAGLNLSINVLVNILLTIIISYFFAKRFNEKYRIKVACKVKKIVDNSKTNSYDELRKICEKKGHPSILLGFLGMIIFLVIMFIILISFYLGIYVYKRLVAKGLEEASKDVCEIITKNADNNEIRKKYKEDLGLTEKDELPEYVSYSFSDFEELKNIKGSYSLKDGKVTIYYWSNGFACSGTCGEKINCGG